MPEIQVMKQEQQVLASELMKHAMDRGAELNLTMMDLVGIADGIRLQLHQLINAHFIAKQQKKNREGIIVPNIKLRGGLGPLEGGTNRKDGN